MRKYLIIGAIAALVLTGCTATRDNDNNNAAPSCSEQHKSDLTKRSNRRGGQEPATLLPTTACDESVRIVDGKAVCNREQNSPVGSFTLTIDDPNNKGWLGQPVKVSRIGAATRIDWGTEMGHTIIVKGRLWGYPDGIGLGGKTEPSPSSTTLYDTEWGGLNASDTIEVCFSGL